MHFAKISVYSNMLGATAGADIWHGDEGRRVCW